MNGQQNVEDRSVLLTDVGFSYRDGELTLRDISLDIRKPQLVSIIGPNGAGKSTLIHCINRILSPSEGTVMVDGTDVSGIGIKELARKVGYVPCSSGDCFPLSVVDTVLMGRNPHTGLRRNLHSDMEVVEEVLDLMDIRPLAMRMLNELSAGQRQRVMLARGLAQEPGVLLLDEPTANLDIRHQMDVARILKELSAAKGMVVIMISHDINLASRYSDSIVLMSEGSIYAAGRPSEVVTAESIKAVYGVDSEIALRGNRPFVHLLDPVFESEEADLASDGTASIPSGA